MAIVAESTTIDEALDGMGPCMELLLKQDGEWCDTKHVKHTPSV